MRETSYSRSIRRRNRAADSISIRSNCNLEEVHHDQSRNDDDVDDNDDKDSGRNDDEAKKSSKCHLEELMVDNITVSLSTWIGRRQCYLGDGADEALGSGVPDKMLLSKVGWTHISDCCR